MSLVRRAVELGRWGVAAAVRGWVLVWAWAHPAAAALREALAAELAAARGWRVAPRLALFALGTPLFVRRQARAKWLAATRTAGGAAPAGAGSSAEGRWRGRLREALLWAVLAGWVAAFALFLQSELTTGKFAPDYAPAPGAPEVISVQFRLAALAAGVPSLVLAALLARRWLPRGERSPARCDLHGRW